MRENLGGVMGRVRILTGCHFVFGGKFYPASVWSVEPGREMDTDRRAREPQNNAGVGENGWIAADRQMAPCTDCSMASTSGLVVGRDRRKRG